MDELDGDRKGSKVAQNKTHKAVLCPTFFCLDKYTAGTRREEREKEGDGAPM